MTYRLLYLIPALLIATATPNALFAETWSDITGKFTVEADYVGVNGKSVVLRLADGTTREVPIAKLSAESRAKAKELYEAAKLNATTPMPTEAAASRPSPSSRVITKPQADFAPAVPPVPDMPAFPEGASLQETVDFIKQQVLAGHPEVMWYALPADLRQEMDSVEVRAAMRPGIMMQVEAQKPIHNVAKKVCEVIIRKKQFVLNTQALQMAPPEAKQMITTLYDPASGLLYELVNCVFDSEMVVNESVTTFVDYYGPRIGGHLRKLVEAAPPGMIDQVGNLVFVNQTDSQSGTITIPSEGGGTTTVDMVAYQGRWMPKEFVSLWKEKGGTMAEGMRQQFEDNKAQMEASRQQMAMATGMISGMADQILQPLLDAKTQPEFDGAIMKLVQMASMFGGNAGPAGPPGFGPPGAVPPGF